jgi:hypothetical protein
MTRPPGGRRRANPVRVTLARELGHDIDGAWWPHNDRIASELPDLVAILATRLGEIIDIDVNWPPLQRPPDLNWLGWQAQAPARIDGQGLERSRQSVDHPAFHHQHPCGDGAAPCRRPADRPRPPRHPALSHCRLHPARRPTATRIRQQEQHLGEVAQSPDPYPGRACATMVSDRQPDITSRKSRF